MNSFLPGDFPYPEEDHRCGLLDAKSGSLGWCGGAIGKGPRLRALSVPAFVPCRLFGLMEAEGQFMGSSLE